MEGFRALVPFGKQKQHPGSRKNGNPSVSALELHPRAENKRALQGQGSSKSLKPGGLLIWVRASHSESVLPLWVRCCYTLSCFYPVPATCSLQRTFIHPVLSHLRLHLALMTLMNSLNLQQFPTRSFLFKYFRMAPECPRTTLHLQPSKGNMTIKW